MTSRAIPVYTANNHFQHAEVLRRNRRKRQQYREFFVEGVRSINAALEHGWKLTALYHARDRPLSDWAIGILERSAETTHYALPFDLLRQLSEKTETSELIALAAMPEDRLERIPVSHNPLIVLFDRPASPGNLGTLIRSCDSLDVDGLIVTGHSVDLYDPETIRASTGSLFSLPTVRVPGPTDLMPWLEGLKATNSTLQLVGTDESGARQLWEHDFTEPTILLAGNETWGLSAGFRELCDGMVRIPMGGFASSLNVACATSIVLYEVMRQRWASRDG